MDHEDLREEGGRRGFSLDIRAISAISVLIFIIGILTGALLPDILQEEHERPTTGWERRLDTYLKCSMGNVEYNGTSYEELDMVTVHSMMIKEELDGYDEVLDRALEMLSFIFPEADSYLLTISQGNGWDGEYSPLALQKPDGRAEGSSISFAMEVDTVGPGFGSLLLNMELRGV